MIEDVCAQKQSPRLFVLSELVVDLLFPAPKLTSRVANQVSTAHCQC